MFTLVFFSPQPVPDQVPEVSPEDAADAPKEPEVAPFPEVSLMFLNLPLSFLTTVGVCVIIQIINMEHIYFVTLIV